MHKKCFIILILAMSTQLKASIPATPGDRLWDMVNCVGLTTQSSVSKACLIESALDMLLVCTFIPINTAPTLGTTAWSALSMRLTSALTTS